MTDSRPDFTSNRALWLKRYYPTSQTQLQKLEKKFSKYLFLPLDVEPILPADPERFIRWYNQHAVAVQQVKIDPLGKTRPSGKHFLSINSADQINTLWEDNKNGDVMKDFPEIAEGVKQLPFGSMIYNIWSSQRIINLHRDNGGWEDLPSSIRIMLHDTNPRPTLYLREAPANVDRVYPMLPLRRTSSNVFCWNNLRVQHGSTWNPKYQKVLLMTFAKIDLDRFEDLLQRSVEKYGHLAHVSQNLSSSFYD